MKSKFLNLTLMLGVSLAAQQGFSAGYQPVPLTANSFTYDIVVESNYNALPCNYAVNAVMDGQGPTDNPPGDSGGNTFYEIGCNYAFPTTGIPHANALLTNAFLTGHIYLMPPSYTKTNDALYIGNFTNTPPGSTIPYTQGNLTVTAPTPYAFLSFLGAAGNGPVGISVTYTHADTTTETYALSVPDWFATGNAAYVAEGRIVPNDGGFQNVGSGTAVKLWSLDVPLTDTTSPVTSMAFTYASGGRAALFSLSGSQDGTNFTPIPVTGFNADVVVEAATPLLPLPYNATMDNGTNIASGGTGANTFFEVGWDPRFPTFGFPAHGTTVISAATGRPYQMAASYTGPMSALIDTNHQLVNITPVTPQAYTAFSLLDAGGDIGGGVMTNIIILQHADGTAETNLFFAYDWFNTSIPVAYNCNGRVNFNDGRGINQENNNFPRLFESQFQLANVTSPVTNIQLRFGTATANNSTTFILAVSATAGGIPVSFASSTVAQNIYSGQTATFTASLAFGSTPTYQWLKSSSFNGPFVNVADGATGSGSTISGSTTTTLTITGAGSSDVGYYELAGTNAATTPAATTQPAPLTLLTATGTNVVVPTDTIVETNNSLVSPAGETVISAIDGTLAPYVNYGFDGTNSPFLGPVGFTVTPQIGSTVVNALRIFTSINAPGDDPSNYTLSGSSDGVTYTAISSGALALPDARNAATGAINVTNEVMQEVDFANTTPYTSYLLTFSAIKGGSTPTNGMQIAEAQFIGGIAQIAPGIVKEPAASLTVYASSTVSMSVTANGPSPITYQWFFGANPISGATSSTYTLSNAQNANAGNYTVKVTNPFGITTSTALALSIVAEPSAPYAQAVIADHPLAYFRLDEPPVNNGIPTGNDGVVAHDYAGGHNGLYTNVFLGVFPGYSANDPDAAAQFGELATNASYVGDIEGISFATPTNQNAELSVEAWVNSYQLQIYPGAGIVTSGLGGGGEQFALDCGGSAAPQNGFRFYFRDAVNNTSHTVNCTNNTGDGLWHHLVAVLDEANTNEYIYVDGILAGQTALAPNLGLAVTNPVVGILIGDRTAADTNGAYPALQFIGNIDEVAIYNYALTASQVQNHYLQTGIAPIISQSPTNETVSQGSTATFAAKVFGSQPISYQWYASDGFTANTPLSGQTSTNLTFVNVQPSLNNTYYQLVVSNSFGSITSSAVLLTVLSGAPTIQTDLQSQYFVYSGYPLVLSVTAGGSPPITYQWQRNSVNVTDGGRISGSQTSTLTIANTQPGDSGNYQLLISNGTGTTPSVLATVTVLPTLGFNGFGSGWSSNSIATYLSSNLVQLTDGNTGEASSTFFSFPVYVGGFIAKFTYQDVGGGGADGFAFVVQNDPRGPAALGGGGGELGYTGIADSAAAEFNVYGPNVPGFAFGTNGVINASTSTPPVGIDGGDLINITIEYLNGVASLTLQDSVVTNNVYHASGNLNIPAAVGGTTAYVGFTGATGGVAATQQISNFSFISLVDLRAQVSGSNIIVTWPAAVGGYSLEQSTSLTSPSWTAVPAADISTSGGVNQATIPIGSGAKFFQLVLP